MTELLPTGTITFLFSDIEGSTRMLARLGSGYPAVLERHDAILRAEIDAHRGTTMGSQGDGMFAVFPSAVDAAAAAIAIQERIGSEAWPEGGRVRVRIGLHTGEGRTSGGTYVGLDVHRAARIGAAGHGGQTVISAATRDLVADALPPGASLRDLGEHQLRDIERREHLYELLPPGVVGRFSALRTEQPRGSNIPAQLTSFVGRSRERAAIQELLDAHRLVTLVGVGGVGKTRLLLEVGSEIADRVPDRTWLVELAPLADPALVPALVARTLGTAEEPGRDVHETLADFVRTKTLVLLLDNVEHLLDAAARLSVELLSAGPGVRIVATGREALGVAGEVVFQVPSLGVPASALPPDVHEAPAVRDAWLDDVAEADAVRLFVERASSIVPSFALTHANAASVVGICRRLDGIPLAIELAAARVPVLSPEEIERALGDRFRLLTGGGRTAVPRQQTLQALIDWSWELLSDEDRRLLARLSVFASGWTLEAATAVTALEQEPADRFDVLDRLTRLVERSLVTVEPGDPTRYGMLETIRQYARERLGAADELGAARDAHLRFFLDLALAAERPLLGPEMVSWLNRLDPEIDNFRVALDWGLETRPELGIQLALALAPYSRVRVAGLEAVERMTAAAEAADALLAGHDRPPRELRVLAARMLAAAAQANAAWGAPDVGQRLGARGIELARDLAADPRSGDGSDEQTRRALAEALMSHSMALLFAGRAVEAHTTAEEVAQLASDAGDGPALAMILGGEALFAVGSGDLAGAVERAELASRAAERSGNAFAIGFAALTQGRIAGFLGDADSARRWIGEAIEHYRAMGDRRFELNARSDLGHALRHAGVLEEAENVYRETIHEWLHLGRRGPIANQLEAFAFIALERGDPLRAARLLGAAEAQRIAGRAEMLPTERPEYEEAVRRLHTEIPLADLDGAWADGRRLSAEAAVALAIGRDAR